MDLKNRHGYYNKKLDRWLYVSKWSSEKGNYELHVEEFDRKDDAQYSLQYQGQKIRAYEATEMLIPVNQYIQENNIKGFVDMGLVDGAFYLSSIYGGGSNTEVDLIYPRTEELLTILKKPITVQKLAKLYKKYSDVLNSPKFKRKNKWR